jgi:ankyrin repeat protein
MESIFAAVLANDPSRITAAAAAQRMDEDLFVAELLVNRRGATALHYACDPRPLSRTWDPVAQRRVIEPLVSVGATVGQPDHGGATPLHRAVRARSPAAAHL